MKLRLGGKKKKKKPKLRNFKVLESLLKLTFHKIILIQIQLQKFPGIQTNICVTVPSFFSKCQECTCFRDTKSLQKVKSTVHLCWVRNLCLHFMKSTLKEPCLGCVLSQHSCINPFSSNPHSGLPSCFLSGRVHLRLFKLTGCLMKTLKEKNAVGIPIILFLQTENIHPP